jgi:hypothetical protein
MDAGYQSQGFQRKGETVYRAPNGRLVGNTPSQLNAQQGTFRAISQPLQYLEGAGGQTVRRAFVDATAGMLGVPKEDELITNPDAKRTQAFGMFVTETGVSTLLTGGLGSALGPTAAAAKARLVPIASRLPAWAQGALRASKAPVKWSAAVAAEEGISSLLGDPYRNGSIADLFPDNPLQVQPGDNIWQAAARTLPGNIATGAVVGGGLELGVNLTTRGINRLLPNASRRTREVQAQREVQEARDWAEQNGLQAKNEDGTYEFAPDADQPGEPAQPARKTLDDVGASYTEATTGIPTAPMEPGGAVLEGKLPEADPKADPWDPEVPEVDTTVRAADQLDNEALERVAQAEAINPALEAELAVKPELVPVNVATGSAPSGNLAEPTTPYIEQFEAFPNSQLLSLAHPDNSEQLFQKVSVMTGKDFDEFTRKDVLAGLKALAETEGIQIIPSRVDPQGLAIADVNAISVDPERFQFKQGVSEKGVQKGQSLSGLERWNTDLEDVLDVWQDPADGKLYVVNGHNRLAKAKEMGIPSLRVNFLTARTAEQARAMGAIKNIGQGAGTPFDAAKFIRERGFETPEQLKQAGLPLKSGLADAGFALSKLPPNLFDDAVAGRLPLNQAITLGKSGLDPEQMGRLMNSLSGRNISDAQLSEMVDMARTAPTVASDQMGLFGAETLDTIEIKADLAARVRAELTSNKSLFKRVSKDKAATKLEGAGTQVDQSRAQQAAAAAEAALGNFDADKYAEGTTLSQMLNQATEEIANGAKPGVVAQRIAREVASAGEKIEAPTPKVLDEDVAPIEPNDLDDARPESTLTAADRNELKKEIVRKAIKNREVRPSTTEIPPSDPGSNAPSLEDLSKNPQAAFGEEVRLAEEYAARDALVENETARKVREDEGFYDQPLEEQLDNGLMEKFPEEEPGTVADLVDDLANDEVEETGWGPFRFSRSLDNGQWVLEIPDLAELTGKELLELGIDDAALKALSATEQARLLSSAWDSLKQRLPGGKYFIDPTTPSRQKLFKRVLGDAYDGKTSLTLGAPQASRIEFPAKAVKAITRKNEGRVPTKANQLMNWANYMLPPEKHLIKSDAQAEALVRAKGSLLDVSQVPGIDIDQALNDRAIGRKTAATDAVADAYKQFYGVDQPPQGSAVRADQPPTSTAPAYQLPADVAKSKPRFGMATLEFGNDLDRAAYIIRSSAKKSKGEDQIVASLEAKGFDIDAVRRHGEQVKKAIGDTVESQTGSRRAPQSSMAIKVDEVPFDAGRADQPLMSMAPAAGEGTEKLRTPEEAKKLIAAMEREVKRITGHDMGDRFKGHFWQSPPMQVPEVHGGKPGDVGFAGGWYKPVEDVMEVFSVLDSPKFELYETMWHESWHRLQMQFLTRKEMAVLNTAFARAKIDDLMPLFDRLDNKASIERQAIAFQTYARMRRLERRPKEGVVPAAQRNAGIDAYHLSRESRKQGIELPERDYDVLIKALGRDAANAWEKLMFKLFNVWEAATNFVNGRGWQTLEDVYERAYSGRMANRRKIYNAKRLLRSLNAPPGRKERLMDRTLGTIADKESRNEFLDLWGLDNDPIKLAEYLDQASKEVWFNSQALMKTAAKEGC